MKASFIPRSELFKDEADNWVTGRFMVASWPCDENYCSVSVLEIVRRLCEGELGVVE